MKIKIMATIFLVISQSPLHRKVRRQKKRNAGLRVSHLLDQRLHVVQIVLQGLTAGSGQLVLGLRQAAFEELRAGDVSGVLEFARVHAEVAVCCVHQILQVAERKRLVSSERADDSQTQS